jgi:hypothetical protein
VFKINYDKLENGQGKKENKMESKLNERDHDKYKQNHSSENDQDDLFHVMGVEDDEESKLEKKEKKHGLISGSISMKAKEFDTDVSVSAEDDVDYEVHDGLESEVENLKTELINEEIENKKREMVKEQKEKEKKRDEEEEREREKQREKETDEEKDKAMEMEKQNEKENQENIAKEIKKQIDNEKEIDGGKDDEKNNKKDDQKNDEKNDGKDGSKKNDEKDDLVQKVEQVGTQVVENLLNSKYEPVHRIQLPNMIIFLWPQKSPSTYQSLLENHVKIIWSCAHEWHGAQRIWLQLENNDQNILAFKILKGFVFLLFVFIVFFGFWVFIYCFL